MLQKIILTRVLNIRIMYAINGVSRQHGADSCMVRSGQKVHSSVRERRARNSYSQLSSSSWARQKLELLLTGWMSTQAMRG